MNRWSPHPTLPYKINKKWLRAILISKKYVRFLMVFIPVTRRVKVFVPKGAQHDQHPTNQAVVKLGTVPGAQ